MYASQKQSVDYLLIATCYHESGHVVAALYNFMKVLRVNTINTKNNIGITEFLLHSYDNVISDYLIHKFLIFELELLYGGLVAEKIYYRDICGSDKFPMHLRIGSRNDLNLSSGIIRKYKLTEPGKETSEFKKEIQENVKNILLEHWDSVKIIAHSLYKKKKLTFDEIKYILTKKTFHNDFWKDRFKGIKILTTKRGLSEKDINNIIF